MLSLGLLQGAATELPWFNGALLVAAFTAAATFTLGQVSAWRTRKQMNRATREALLSALHAEVTVIRNGLRDEIRLLVEDFKRDDPLSLSPWGRILLPTRVYQENVKSLGLVGNNEVVEQIVTLYSRLEGAEEQERLLREVEVHKHQLVLLYYRKLQVTLFVDAALLIERIDVLLDNPDHGERLPADEKLFNEAIELLDQRIEDVLRSLS